MACILAVSLGFGLFLAGRSCYAVIRESGAAVAKTTEATAALIRADRKQTEVFLAVFKELNARMLQTQADYTQLVLQNAAGLRIRTLLHSEGLTAFMQSPETKVYQEIEALAKTLGVSENEAKKIILDRVRDRSLDGNSTVQRS